MSHALGLNVGRWPLLVAIFASLLFTSSPWAQDEPAAGDKPAAAATDETDKPAVAGEEKADEAKETAPAGDDKKADTDKKEETAAPTSEQELAYSFNTIFLFICAVLVLFMQAGFAMLEAGFNEAKNVVNILCKNLMDLCVGVLLFFVATTFAFTFDRSSTAQLDSIVIINVDHEDLHHISDTTDV